MEQKNSLSRHILRVCLAFSLCLSLGVGLVGFTIYTRGMMARYQEYLGNLLRFVQSQLDGDDIGQMVETYEEGESYAPLQQLLDDVRDTYDVEFIYLFKPLTIAPRDSMVYVATGYNAEQRELYPRTTLGFLTGDEYDEADSARFYHWFYETCPTDHSIRYFAYNSAYGRLYSGFCPILNSAGEPVAILGADITIQNMVNTLVSYGVLLLVGCLAFSGLFLWLLYHWMKRRVIDPVQQMEAAARNFVQDTRQEASPETLNFAAPEIHTGDEIQMLSDALEEMSEDVKSYLTNLLTQTKEKERIASELGVAAKIQSDMLPGIFPVFPQFDQFDVFASMDPAKEVGGDFYDFFQIDHDHLALVIADVSGKGVPAALFMVIAKTLLKNRAQQGGSPAQILKDVNEQLCVGNESKMFVSVWLAILEISTGKGVAANAGHEHPALMGADGDFQLVKYRHSPVLGIMKGIPFREHAFTLNPGDTLFVYTDGVPEATNRQDELFGTDRMLEALNRRKEEPLEQLLRGLRKDIETFADGAAQFDDITMLGFRYSGESLAAHRLKVEADTANLDKVTAFVEEQLEAYGCPPAISIQIQVALEELFVNIAHYAYDGQPGPAEIQTDLREGTAILRFIDQGKPFDPLARKDPDVSKPAAKRQVGGLGIYMVKKTMDSVSYQRMGDRNVLTICKKIS